MTVPTSELTAPLYPFMLCYMKFLKFKTVAVPSLAPYLVAPSPKKCLADPRTPLILPPATSCKPFTNDLAYCSI